MGRLARKFWATLTPQERGKVLLLTGAVMVMATLEVINVSAIMPFLTAATNPGTIQDDPLLSFLYTRLGFDDEGRFLVALGLAVFSLMLLSNAWLAFTAWMQARFVWSWNHTLSTRLLKRYLCRPYEYFLTRNTADLSKNILSEVQQISAGLLLPAIEGFGRAVVAASIIVVLFLTEPLLALLVTVIVGGAYGLVFSLARHTLDRVGVERLAANQERFTVASEALGGIKDVKLLGKEREFLARFERPSARFSEYQATSQIIGALPRYAVEPIGFGSVVLIVVYLISSRGDLSAIVPVLGFYAFAGYRLMPAVQQAFRGLTQIRFFAPALQNLLDEMGEISELPTVHVISGPINGRAPARLCLERGLELRNVSFRYPGSEVEAVRDLSLSIAAKSTVGLVGATGSGKTTVADLILGLLRPQAGDILVDGIPITEANLAEWQAMLGYVPQHIFLMDASVAENIAFGVPREQIDMEAVREAARIAMIDDFVVKELPRGYDTVVGERGIRLSGGQRQRIGIARALYRNPSVLVFDEATSALDNRTEEAVMNAIRSLLGSRTVIIIAHRLSTLRDCDVIHMLDHGRLVGSGSFRELVKGEGRLAKLARPT